MPIVCLVLFCSTRFLTVRFLSAFDPENARFSPIQPDRGRKLEFD